MLEKNFGEKVRTEVADKMIQDTYFEALEETKLDAVVHPEIKSFNYEDDGSLTYEAEIDIRPEFELGDYKGLEIEQAEIVVDESAVDLELENQRQQMAPLRSVDDRAIQEGDQVVIDFEGFHDGAPMDQVKGENYTVNVGSGNNGKEFEDNFLGLLKGEETSRSVDFPADFANPVLAGKNVEFKVKVRDIKERILPELDDEFAKDVGKEFNTLDELKESIRAKLRQHQEETSTGDLNDKIMFQLLEAHDIEIPNRLVAYEINALIKETENNLEKRSPGMTLEAAGISHEQLTEQYKDSATKRVKGDFILKKIAEKEEITVTEEDMNKAFQRIADQYSMSLADVKQYFRKREDLLPFMNEILSEKIIEMLRTEAKIKTVPAAEEK